MKLNLDGGMWETTNELISPFMTKIGVREKTTLVRTSLDETISVVGPIGWHGNPASEVPSH